MENTIALSITDASTANDVSLYITAQEEKQGDNKSFEFIFGRYRSLLPFWEMIKFGDFLLSQLRSNAKEKKIRLFEANPDAVLDVTGRVNEKKETEFMLVFMYWGRVGYCETFLVNSEQAKEMVEFISVNL